ETAEGPSSTREAPAAWSRATGEHGAMPAGDDATARAAVASAASAGAAPRLLGCHLIDSPSGRGAILAAVDDSTRAVVYGMTASTKTLQRCRRSALRPTRASIRGTDGVRERDGAPCAG